MRRLASAALAVGLLATVAPAADDGVHRLPAFDHEGVEASYVVAAPPDYDASRKWPLILDLHGAIAPERRGAEVTRSRLWSRFVERVPCIVAAPNGRTRAWGRVDGELDDGAYVRAVLDDVRTRYAIDDDRVYLAGFSSGSDFACSGGLQVDGPFAATLVVCAGPRSVLGLRDGKLLRAVDHPFLFATGEEDYIRKAGSWEAALALKGAGGRAVYREVPGVGHAFFGVDEYAELFRRLERLARGEDDDVPPPPREEGDALLARAERIDAAREPGAAYEAWWRLATAFHHVPELRERGEAGMAALAEAHDNRTLMRARGDYFRRRRPRAPDEPASAPAAADPSLFRFDRYLGPKELGDALADLARRFPDRCRLVSIGKSIEGRDIPLLEITDRRSGSASEKPAVWIEGAIHGNEASSSMAVLYAAWQFAANPERSRTVDRLLGRTTLYAAPVVNPDALHHYLTEPHSHWRPRFNYRPHDADGDGRVDEDGYEDLDGDGEIGQMYVEDPQGPFVRKGERIVRGDGSPRYRVVGREGRDDDGDGRFSEDPPGGVNLNRNFPVGFRPRRDFEGMRGPRALSEPETRAIVDAVTTRRNVALFLDVHNDGDCLFVWHGPDAPDEDVALQEGIAGRALDVMGYATRPLRHAGAGLSIAWSYGRMGIPSAIVELESKRGKREDYLAEHYDDAGFLPLRPFEHPQLGPILIGGDFRKLPRRQMHPEHLYGQVDRHWAWLRAEMGRLPRLELVDPVITPVAAEPGTFRVTGGVRNAGEMPTDTVRAVRAGRGFPVEIGAEGATLSDGRTRLGGPGPGETVHFDVTLRDVRPPVTLRVSHPRAGAVTLGVVSPEKETVAIRREFAVEEGYLTPDRVTPLAGEWFEDGRPKEERWARFDPPSERDEVRVAVLLGEWADRRHTVPALAFARAFFSEGGAHRRSATGQPAYGSLADFYREMSHGRVTVTGRVFDWAELPGPWKAARDASFGSRDLSRALIAAIRERDGEDALDGFDAVAVVWAGNAVARTSMLWPMRIAVDGRPDLVAFKMSELFRGEMAPIGVPAHELGHTFGVNDKYGLGAPENPFGPFCLIGKGTHGGTPSGRHRPFHFCAWCKSVLGWTDPVAIDPKREHRLALRPITFDARECFRIPLTPDGSDSLLLENRRREGFHTDLPAEGLHVIRVRPHTRPSAPQRQVELLPAHGLPRAARSDPASPDAVAWPQPGRTELLVDGVRIGDIRLVDGVVHFTVGPAD